MQKLIIFLTFCLTLICQEVFPQVFFPQGEDRKWVANGGFGISSYYGDLNNPGDIIDFTPGLTLGARRHINSKRLGNRFSVGGNITWFMLSGDDAKANNVGREVRNLSFQSHNIELLAIGQVDLFPRGPRFYQRSDYNPYLFAGIGLLYFNPRAKYEGEWYPLRRLQTEGVKYSPVTLVIPLGIGVRYRLNPMFNIVLEGGYRFAFTDYLDDVSTVFKDPASFDNPMARTLADRREEIGLPKLDAGKKRGNPNKNDGYFLLQIKAEYYMHRLFGPDPYNRTIRRRR